MSTQQQNKSFQPKGKRVSFVQIPGTFVSSHTSQVCVSTGVPSLDKVLRGGIPMGSLVLLGDETDSIYADYFMRCFLSEGATMGHELMVASCDNNPETVIQNLPAPVINEKDNNDMPKDDSQMTIAWRYQQQKKVSNFTDMDSHSHHYNVKSPMSVDIIEKLKKFTWGNKVADSANKYQSLYSATHDVLKRRQFYSNEKRAEPNVMRIAIQYLGSQYWKTEENATSVSGSRNELTTFVALLRSLLLQSTSVAFVTISSECFKDRILMNKLKDLADYMIELETFQGTNKEVNPLFKDYHGLLNIHKVSVRNCLVPPNVDRKDWVFKLKRRMLCIEKLHLPPDLSETVSRSSQVASLQNPTSGCGGGMGSKLDF